MSTAAMVRAVQDQVLAEGASAAETAVYGSVVTVLAELCGDPDADTTGFRGDAVLHAARPEVSVELVAAMGDWVGTRWDQITVDAAVLDDLDDLVDPFPVVPAVALTYRHAAQELVLAAGDCCAAVAWAGGAAVAQWLRLYGGHTVTDAELCAADPVLEAVRRELTEEQMRNITAWVHRNWVEIDSLASTTERAA